MRMLTTQPSVRVQAEPLPVQAIPVPSAEPRHEEAERPLVPSAGPSRREEAEPATA